LYLLIIPFNIRLVKTLAKPVAARLKKEAKKRPYLTKVCIETGQISHQFSARLNSFASGYKVVGINPLPEEDALSRGINFMSEFLVFSIAGGIIIIEYARSEEKNAQKAEQIRIKEAEFKEYLEQRFSSLDTKLQSLERQIHSQETEIVQVSTNI
jgi:optic atrophy 3 protein